MPENQSSQADRQTLGRNKNNFLKVSRQFKLLPAYCRRLLSCNMHRCNGNAAGIGPGKSDIGGGNCNTAGIGNAVQANA